MPSTKVYHQSLNTGVVDSDKLHRVDLERLRLAASDQTNILCNVVGKGFVRPGFGYLATNKGGNKARLMPFVAGQTSAFQLELTDFFLRVRNGTTDALVTRPSVTAAVTSGDFSASTGWTLASSSGQSSTVSGGELLLAARAKGAEASATQTLTINEIGTEHALNIVVTRGPIMFRLGSTSGGDEYIGETTLRTGTHSLAFTPTGGSAYIRFSSKLPATKKVTSCTVEAAGVMALPTIWPVADLGLIRADQSLDVMYLAARGYRQQRIERRGDTSWSVVDYTTDDGPFFGKTADVITLNASVLEGNGTLTASAPFFNSGHVGALFELTHQGQRLDTYLAAADQFTDTIEVTGINETNYNDRDWTYTLAGTWTATVHVQRSFDSELVGFQAFRREQGVSTIDITANATYIDDDNEDNSIAWYRVGIENASYTSGEVHVTAQYTGGQGFGIVRVVGYTSSTQVDIEVLKPLKGNYATKDWREGSWSANLSYPSAVAFAEGRLIWAGDDHIWASESDAYEAFDETTVGDSAPLLRAIAIGGRNNVEWMLNLLTLLIGTDSRMLTVQANSLGDTITPTNFKVVPLSKVGAAPLSAVDLQDNRAIFVERAGVNLFEVSYAPYPVSSYMATQFSQLNTELFTDGITDLGVSIVPDQRIWVVTDGGDACCIVYNPAEKVVAFIPIATTTGDIIESVCVLPGDVQDRVYVSVQRTVNGVTTHYTEKLALDSECKPATVTKCMDSFLSGTGAHSATINLAHLVGRTVVAWVDGAPVAGNFTVDNSGNITLPNAPTAGWCVGVPFDWTYESARLEYGLPNQTPMLNVKALKSLSILFADYVRGGVSVGTRDAEGNLSNPSGLPKLINGKAPSNVVSGVVGNEHMYSVPGGASVDQRLRITGSSPNCASILGLVLEVENYGG